MFKASHLAPLLAAIAFSSVSVATPNSGNVAQAERVGDFTLLDHQGELHQLSRYRHKKALVIFSQANSCKLADADVPELRELRAQWEDKDVAFVMMNSVASEERDDVIAAANKKSLDFPILLDITQLIAGDLNITKAGQVVVLDPHNMTVAYRGPLHVHVNTALENMLAGKSQDTMVMDSRGCDIKFPAKAKHEKNVPDYAADIAPIIKENCADCHREGGVAPFAMNSYMMIKGFAPMIREVLLTNRMPPMQVDPYINHFTNANYVAKRDMQTLIHWIDAGAPRGDSDVDPLESVAPVNLRDWVLGEPDHIVTAPTHEVPATGVLDYINEEVVLEFDEDKWVKAVQFIPGDPAVLHHLLTYVTGPKEQFEGGEGDRRSIARRFLEGYAPGKVEPLIFPENTGVFIPKGHKLSMQFHYTTNGKATTDTTIVGLYFHDEPPKYEYLNRSVSGRFTIPPYALNHPAHAEYVFEEDVVIHAMRAHMHFRGKEMRFAAEYPDGTVKQLMSVPNYSYAWQPTFQLVEPITIPAGTKVLVDGHFDNSEHNPYNPDPSKELTFGLQTWDEMFIGYFSYHTVKPANE